MFDIVKKVHDGLKHDPVAQATQRLQRAKEIALAAKIAKLTRALKGEDMQAIIRSKEDLDVFTETVTTATDELLAHPNGSKKGAASSWKVIDEQPPAIPEVSEYIITASTLATCYPYLTQRLPRSQELESEFMLALTGIRQGNLRSLEQIISVDMETQSFSQASWNIDAFMKTARTLDEYGQGLHAIFHSHRFPGAPTPSGVDWKLQRILDEGGYPTIQAVFSEDGFVRFFANKPFRITVSGKGVKTTDEKQHLYQIVGRGRLPTLFK